MHFGEIVSMLIGGSFGIIFLGSLAVYVVASTTKYCMPIFKDVLQEYTKWKLERAKEDAEFLKVYEIYKRINKQDSAEKEAE